jgi:hypothetical protein
MKTGCIWKVCSFIKHSEEKPNSKKDQGHMTKQATSTKRIKIRFLFF